MSKPKIPALERKVPGHLAMTIGLILLYLIVVPINWIMQKLGMGPRILSSILQQQLG